MHLAAPFSRRRQGEFHEQHEINSLTRTGSWPACILASTASILLIFSAGAQNVSYGWQLGLAHSEFRAVVLAMASAGATILGPACFVAVFCCCKRRNFGTALTALVLGAGALAYAAVCSLGFVAGSRDTGISERLAISERSQDRRELIADARHELRDLQGKPAYSRIVERRRELTALLVDLSKVEPGKSMSPRPDSQAAGVAFVLGAAGWRVEASDVGQWLNVSMVAFLEIAAALSLTVAAALKPELHSVTQQEAPGRLRTREAPSPTRDTSKARKRRQRRAERDFDDDDAPPPPMPRGKAGRKPTVLAAEAVKRLQDRGGKVAGSLNGIGKALGARSKTAAHRLLHGMASAGMIRLHTHPRGVAVACA